MLSASTNVRGCNSDWRQLRAIHLADGTYCRKCQRRGAERRAKIVDHLDP
jgi:hypothetical protein